MGINELKIKRRNMPSQKKIFEYWESRLDSIYPQQCFACSSLDTTRLERAHIFARCDGGSDKVDNLHLLCRHCHVSSETISGEKYWQWFKYTFENWIEITIARCKPHINMALNNLNDLERGEYDCVVGYQALDGQSEAYYLGYGEQYAKEQTVGGASGN